MMFRLTSSILMAVFVCGISASIRAMPPAKAFGAMIRVGDVVPGCPQEMCEVEVVPAPLPGRTRVVRKRDVIAAIERAGYKPSGLRIPERRRVTRPARRVSEDALRKRILDAVNAVLPKGTRLEELGHVRGVDVPRAGFEARATWPGMGHFRRRVSVPVDLISDGKKFLTIQVSALLVIETDIPVARRDLHEGTVVTQGDLVWETVRMESLPTHLATTPSEIVGRQIAAHVGKGDYFEQRSLKRIPVVRKGGQLTVESVFGLVRVKTTGVSRQDAAVGDRIRIVLVPANRLVWAEITAPGRAVVMP